MKKQINDPVIYIDIRDEIHMVNQIYPEIGQDNLLVYFTQIFDYACDAVDSDIDQSRSYFNIKEYYKPKLYTDGDKWAKSLSELERSFYDISLAIADKIYVANRKVNSLKWFHYRLDSFNAYKGDAILTSIIPY